jgi:hypothetical protein
VLILAVSRMRDGADQNDDFHEVHGENLRGRKPPARIRSNARSL